MMATCFENPTEFSSRLSGVEVAMENPLTRILLVEDDEDDYIIIRDFLAEIEGQRFELEWVSTYESALAAAGQDNYDLYLVDYRLGERDGLELLREFQVRGCRAPIILLTGWGDHEVDVVAMQAGAADYLEKGQVNAHLLERSIRHAVERAHTLEALRASEARFRGIFFGAPIGIAVLNTDGRIAESNPTLGKMLGYTTGELQGMDLREIVHPEDVEAITQRFQEFSAGKVHYRQMESRYLQKHGQWMWGRLQLSLLQGTEDFSRFAIGMIEDITERKRAEEELRESERQLRVLSTRLLEAQEKERQLVARELHDGVGASLAAIKYALETKIDQQAEDSLSLEQLVAMVQQTIEETRRISSNLRPSILDDLGVVATLRWLCRKFQEVYSGVQVETRLSVKENELPEPLKIAIYRISQEALNNIAKHSGATEVKLFLDQNEKGIRLSIEDNGRGFEVSEVLREEDHTCGMGLTSMKERTQHSGGTFNLCTKTAGGTIIEAVWPLAAGQA